MGKFFIPYSDDAPAPVNINGHRVLIVTTQSEDIGGDLGAFGGTEVRELTLREGDEDGTEVLADLAASINGGVVLTPPGISFASMVKSLEEELPWIH